MGCRGVVAAECWSLGGLLALATNIETSCAAMDLSEFGPNVGLLVCWSVAGSVLKKKRGQKKRKEKKDQQTNNTHTYIPISLIGTTFSGVGRRPTFDQHSTNRPTLADVTAGARLPGKTKRHGRFAPPFPAPCQPAPGLRQRRPRCRSPCVVPE